MVPDEVLIEFDGPLTFTFRRQDGGIALAHLSGIGASIRRYVVSNTGKYIVRDLKSGLISIRQALLHSPLWIIDVMPGGQITRAWRATAGSLPGNILPAEGVLLTPELEAMPSSDSKLASFVQSGSDGQIVFNGRPVENHYIEAGFYGKFCNQASELLSQIAIAVGVNGPVPLLLGMTAKSSYAVELRLGQQGDKGNYPKLFATKATESDVDMGREAFDYMVSMLVDENLPESSIVLVKTSRPVRQQFGGILELVSTNAASLSVRTRSDPSERRLSNTQAGERLVRVRDLGYPYNYLYVIGRLIGGQVEASNRKEPNFLIRVERGDNVQDFHGPVDRSALEKLAAIRWETNVRTRLRIEDRDNGHSYTPEMIGPAAPDEAHSIA